MRALVFGVCGLSLGALLGLVVGYGGTKIYFAHLIDVDAAALTTAILTGLLGAVICGVVGAAIGGAWDQLASRRPDPS